jgi:2-oxoisovalerate dehydrogenase E1 component
MPKSQYVDPAVVRAAGEIEIPNIPLCAYDISFAKERKAYGDDKLIGVFEDMALIREFESMLQKIKMEQNYHGIEYEHKGPAHLSVGQEAAAVGQALNLTIDDHIFGSHRSHGEILAKGMAAIRQLSDDDLLKIMKEFDDGKVLAVVDDGSHASVRDLAIDFLLYGSLAEIFARVTGFNQGLGGSMHAFFTPFGIYPNNAIVGGSADIATGAALFKRVNKKGGLCIANIGDASMGCGPVWEAFGFASMDQYNQLWDEAHQGGLPIIFNVMNNFYGMGGQTAGETMAYGSVARIGAGVNPHAMHAERVDGYNPLAVADAIRRKREVLENGTGPVLLETLTYRISGHSPSDASSYRMKEEIEAWQKVDPILAYGEQLAKAKVLSGDDAGAFQDGLIERLKRIVKLAIDPAVSDYIPGERIGELMFSNRTVMSYGDEGTGELNHEVSENPRVQQISKKSRTPVDENGKKVSKARTYNLSDGIFEAMLDGFVRDPTMVAYGEENRDWGGAFGAYRGLTEALPYHRLFNSPISEAAIVGTACGYALEGGRAVVELMYCDFLGRAGDEIFNQLAKWQSMSAGVLEMPVVLRVSVGMKYGAQHSQDWSAIVGHIPGLKAAFPVTPYDAKGILNLALTSSDPWVIFESQRLYGIGEDFAEGGVPEGFYTVDEGQPIVRREGSDLTIVTVGATLYHALAAADELQSKYGISAEVIDTRFVNPLDYDVLIESAKKTGRVLLTADACERGSILETIGSTITQAAFGHLDAPPVIVGARNWIAPGPELEEHYFPQPFWLIDAIHEQILPLNGHVSQTNQTFAERLRRHRAGV